MYSTGNSEASNTNDGTGTDYRHAGTAGRVKGVLRGPRGGRLLLGDQTPGYVRRKPNSHIDAKSTTWSEAMQNHQISEADRWIFETFRGDEIDAALAAALRADELDDAIREAFRRDPKPPPPPPVE